MAIVLDVIKLSPTITVVKMEIGVHGKHIIRFQWLQVAATICPIVKFFV